ncbi:MAG: hypothetical protein IPL10_12400 [Bacteroidetes bacterium]|nr:hypothetical protein [Bacteroidota bacterium]
MPSKLSSDELFHFTKFENLLSILDQGFQPRYNLEHTFLSDMYKRPSAIAAIPMVCFCDIPLDMVEEHSTKYGKCGLVLTRVGAKNMG